MQAECSYSQKFSLNVVCVFIYFYNMVDFDISSIVVTLQTIYIYISRSYDLKREKLREDTAEMRKGDQLEKRARTCMFRKSSPVIMSKFLNVCY